MRARARPKLTRSRVLILGGVVLFLVFAVQGGEYSTGDWLELKEEERAEQRRVDSLKHEVDSLSVVARKVETDSATQERIARDSYRMIRQGEYVYIIEGDTSSP